MSNPADLGVSSLVLQTAEGGDINPVYLGIFVVYLLLVLAIGAWAYLETDDVNDFWVYGKRLGPWLATWSYVANFVSAVSVIGFIGAVYGDGYSIMTGIIFGLMLGVSGLYFVVHKVRELNHVTFPDIIAELTGTEVARPIAGFVLLANAWVYLIMQLVGAGLLVTVITGVPYEYMIWVIGGVFILYTVLGGLVSVAWTDLVQGTLMVATVAVALVYITLDLGGIVTINQQFAALDSGYVAPLGDGTYTGLAVLASIVAFFGTIFTSQATIIRINATDSIRTAKIHLAAAGVILAVFYTMLIMLGAGTTVALTDAGLTVDNVDMAFPVLITEYVPTTIGTVIIVAILSGILSTTDTRLHACGVTTARDIYDYFTGGEASDEKLMRVSRLSTIGFGIAATAIAVNPPGTIIGLYEWRAVLLTSALLIPVYVALYSRDTPGKAVLLSIILGTAFGPGWEAFGAPFGAPPTFMGVGMALIGLTIGHLVLKGQKETPAETAVGND
ncbi:sodium:solute symporter family protein [Natronococcus wangiae]|uniref:sodium:solute symporter family protein n=1 Tax=Natronococcus wangiae TaxID=3068275 RepID=UPI00273FF57E|nr:sodium:solute symporter family protein [Natronococcus sp. AD5]